MSIYRSCDICGDAASELTPQLYRSWGGALGRQLPPAEKIVVGGDGRASTHEFMAALIDGLCSEGAEVVDVGMLPTPMIYYAKHRLRAGGCAIVTGSHHPATINGLKWLVGRLPPTRDDVVALKRDAEADSLASPTGERRATGDAPRAATTPRTLDVSFDYVACLQERFVDSLGAEQRVVLDPLSGAWAGKVRRYLNAIFPHCLFSTIHNTPSPDLDGRTPDCSRPGELHELCDAVYRERAHLGIAFDGDGDRLALIDNEGVALSADETAWILLQSLASELPGESFIHDVKLSDRIVEAARGLRADPLAERNGAAQIRARMQQTGALFGVETGGHYFYRELEGYDDSLHTACRLIAWLATQPERSLADLRRGCPAIYMTPDLHLALAEEARSRVVEQVCRAWSQYPQQTLDGVRINTSSGWIWVSDAAAGPLLTFRFEGNDWPSLERLVERFCQSLPELGDALWQRYRTAMGVVEDVD